MENTYKTPESSVSQSSDSEPNTAKKVISTLCSILPFGMYIACLKIIPQFAETFASFGTELPTFTLILLKLYPLIYLLAFLSLFPLLLWVDAKAIQKAQKYLYLSGIINCVAAFAFLAVVMAALYAPIYSMGSNI